MTLSVEGDNRLPRDISNRPRQHVRRPRFSLKGPPVHAGWRSSKGVQRTTDEEIEDMVRQLIEEHLAEENRKAALDWLDTRTIYYAAAKRLGLA
jgi:hypothetical protein